MQLLAGTDAGRGGGVRVRVRGGILLFGCTGRGWSGGSGQGHTQERTHTHTHRNVHANVVPARRENSGKRSGSLKCLEL